jgi:hypothetical protein
MEHLSDQSDQASSSKSKKARSQWLRASSNQQYESNYGDLWGCAVKVLKEQVT